MSKPDACQACGEARTKCEKPRHKKTRHRAGFSIIGSGGALYELYADKDEAVSAGRLMSAQGESGHSASSSVTSREGIGCSRVRTNKLPPLPEHSAASGRYRGA